MSRGRKVVAYLLMLGLIVKHLLTNEYGPLDRFLEIGICLFVFYEVMVTILGQFRARKLHRQVLTLEVLLQKGQELQRNVPEPSHDPTRDTLYGKIEEWKNAVESWRTEVHNYLEKRSPRAAAVFALVQGTGLMGQVVQASSGHTFTIEGAQRHCYQRLVAYLENLRGIMEKPEVYF